MNKSVSKYISIADFLTHAGLVASKSAAKRLIIQGGIRVDGHVVDSPDAVMVGDIALADGGPNEVIAWQCRQCEKIHRNYFTICPNCGITRKGRYQ